MTPSYGGGAPEGGGGGRPQKRSLGISDLKSAITSTAAFPLRPCGPPPPYDGGGQVRRVSVDRRSGATRGRPRPIRPARPGSPSARAARPSSAAPSRHSSSVHTD